MKNSAKRATASRVAQFPQLSEALDRAAHFCRKHSMSLDRFAASSIDEMIDSCEEDPTLLGETVRINLLKNPLPPVDDQSGLAQLINCAARVRGKMSVTVTFEITPAAFRQLLAGAAESGAGLDELVGHVPLDCAIRPEPS